MVFCWRLLLVLGICEALSFRDDLRAITAAITEKYFKVFKCVTYVVENEGMAVPKWSSSQQNEHDTDTDFLDIHDMYYMPNLIFVAASGNANAQPRFTIFGHNYFHGYKYDVLQEKHEIIDTWDSARGFEKNENLFPDKIANLNGKLVTLSLIQYGPYALVMRKGAKIVYDGVETRIAAHFVESLNGTWTGKDNPVHLWGKLYDNGTNTGIVGSVFENKADMGFSAIYQWYCDVLECSYPYIKAGVTCLAPKPEIVSGWHTIILPFEYTTWMAFTANYGLVTSFVFFTSILWNRVTGEAPQSIAGIMFDSVFNTFRLHLAQVPVAVFKRNPVAHFLKIWLVYCFFIGLYWQGGIASFLTVPRYEKPIDGAEDLLKNFPRIRWGANHDAWMKSIENASDPVTMKIVKEFVVMDEASLKSRMSKKDFAYFLERLPNGHYGMSDYIDREGMKYLRVMEQDLYFAYCVIILTRGSPYQERLDKVLHRMIDAGIIMKMEYQVSLELMDNKLQHMIRSSTEKRVDSATKLRASHIQGALVIYVAGIALSSAVLLTELCCGGPSNSRNLFHGNFFHKIRIG